MILFIKPEVAYKTPDIVTQKRATTMSENNLQQNKKLPLHTLDVELL